MEVRIVFKNGTELQASMSGNSLIVAEQPQFPKDLSTVIVRGENYEAVYHSARVQECASVDGRYWFTFLEESESERIIRELREENEMLEGAIMELAEIIGGVE
jgi:hypothetical protein